jgi:glycosyltransferase involved in cell wall biosynthesis
LAESAKETPVAAVVLTWNEERNLPGCLESLRGWVNEIVVVDSGSTDRTREIARQSAARIVEHPFETHARQWAWALRSIEVRADWVLGLDADQRITPELAAEIQRVLADGAPGWNGFYLKRRQIFRGTWIRHGGYYPKYLLKLFRRAAVSVDERELVDHHFCVAGRAGRLRHDLVEENLNENDLTTWIAKHVRYAALQAQEEFTRGGTPAATARLIGGTPDERVAWWRHRVWERLPLYVRPLLYFLYRYVVRLGFLDGKEGFLFHFLQAYWYRVLVDARIDELRRRESP